MIVGVANDAAGHFVIWKPGLGWNLVHHLNLPRQPAEPLGNLTYTLILRP
jgi:hypothetical protein